MAKTQARTKPKGGRRQGPRKKPPPPWYRRPETRTWAAVLGLAVVAAATLYLTRDRPPEQSSSSLPVTGGDLHSLVVDPVRSARLFVGGHEAVAVSEDGGKTWEPIPSLENADAMGWAFTDQLILVGGHPGISVSTDGGKTFEPRNDGLPLTDIHALGAGEDVIYAGSPAAGVLASTDQGASWEIRSEEAGRAFMGRILVDPQDHDHLVAPDMQAGAAASTDGGRSWNALGGVQGAMWVTWDPNDTDHIIVTSTGAAAESTDGGDTWHDLDIPEDASIVEMNPDDPNLLYAAVLDAPEVVVYVSRDGGETWRRP
jgi:photosystem II stability/assembly factor-like uncharacterized protein